MGGRGQHGGAGCGGGALAGTEARCVHLLYSFRASGCGEESCELVSSAVLPLTITLYPLQPRCGCGRTACSMSSCPSSPTR